MIIFRSLLSRPEKFYRAAAELLKTSSLIVGNELKSRIYLMSIYLKTNKKCPPEHFGGEPCFLFPPPYGILFKQPYLRSPIGKTVLPKDSLMISAAAK